MADRKIVAEWLGKADEDYNFALDNLREGNTFFAQVCFHFHQAAEKYLKAFIVAHDLEFEKVHNLIHLLKICSQKNASLESLGESCELLNAAYIETRYPVNWPTSYSKEKAELSKNAAMLIAETIKKTVAKQ